MKYKKSDKEARKGHLEKNSSYEINVMHIFYFVFLQKFEIAPSDVSNRTCKWTLKWYIMPWSI
jgi:hypothetical protein